MHFNRGYLNGALAWLSSTSVAGRLIGGFFFLTAIIVIVWQIENYRGTRRLNLAKTNLTGEMMSWDWRDFRQKPVVPCERNLAAQPPFNTITVTPAGNSYYADIESAIRPLFEGLPQELLKGRIGELRNWADRLDPEGDSSSAAQRVLQATSHLEPQIQELHDALQFEECQWMQLDYGSMDMAPVPQISNMTDTSKKLAVLLFTRAEASLNSGDSNKAARDILTVIRFCEIARFEKGTLVGALVRASMSQAVPKAELHRLLMHPNWSDASLLQVQEAMAPIDLLGHFDTAMQAELAGAVGFGTAAMNGEAWTQGQWSLGGVDWGPEANPGQWIKAIYRGLRNRCYYHLPKVMPRGWHRQNMAVTIDWWDKNILSLYDSQNRLIDRTREADSSEIAKAELTPYNFLAKLIVPQITNFGRSMAESQTQWDLLRVVCALQRYRLKHRSYPEHLDGLAAGEFIENLPHDYVSGKRPNYDRREQSFTLASLDWDGTGQVDDLVCHVVGDSF